jgi:hypothetical protein
VLTNQLIKHHCEICHRPDKGVDRCPHAIDPRYQCPHDREHKRRIERIKHLGK